MKKRKLNIFELTCPGLQNIEARHIDKLNKYAHFLTDMSGYKPTLTCFEVSTLGHITTRNHKHLQYLHTFMKPGIKLSEFKKNISALSLYASFHIFHNRKQQDFVQPPYLVPPFSDRSQGK